MCLVEIVPGVLQLVVGGIVPPFAHVGEIDPAHLKFHRTWIVVLIKPSITRDVLVAGGNAHGIVRPGAVQFAIVAIAGPCPHVITMAIGCQLA